MLSRESPAYGQVEATGDLQKNARPVDYLTIWDYRALYTVVPVQDQISTVGVVSQRQATTTTGKSGFGFRRFKNGWRA